MIRRCGQLVPAPAAFLVGTFLLLAGAGDTVRADVVARADSLWAAGHHAAAVAVLDSAVTAAGPDADPLVMVRLGARRVALGRIRAARTTLAAAARRAAARRDTAAWLPALRWWGLAAQLGGALARADSLYLALDRLAAAAGDPRHRGWAHVGMAARAMDDGRPTAADSLYALAARLLERGGDRAGMLWAANGRGLALDRQGRLQAALAVYRDVARRAAADGSVMNRANALNNVGAHWMVLGDPARGRHCFRQAAALLDSVGMAEERVVPLLNIAVCARELGEEDTAATLLDSLLTAVRQAGLTRQAGLVALEAARLNLTRHRPAAAVRGLREALAGPEGHLPGTRARLLATLAPALTARGEAATARRLLLRERDDLPLAGLGEAAVEFDLALARLLVAGGRTAAAESLLAEPWTAGAGHVAHRIERAILAARCAVARGDTATAETRLAAAARLWARDRMRIPDPRWRETRTALGRELFLDRAALLLARRGAAAVFDSLQGYKARTLLERMTAPGAGPSAPAVSATLSAVRRELLPPGRILLDWYTGPAHGLLLAVTADTCLAVPLPDAATVARRVDLLLRATTDAPDRADGAPAAALRRALLGPAAPLAMGAREVVSSPDGPLHRLPLTLLLGSPRDTTGTEAADPPVIWRVPSAAVWLHTHRTPVSDNRRGLLALGPRPDERGRAGLPGAVREVNALAATYRRVEVLLLPDDTAGDVRERIRRCRVLHVASHVRPDDQHPWRSSIPLPLTPAGDTLTAAAVLAEGVTAPLVVLAGCGTAAGREIPGEGVTGLAAAFLAAGGRAVVATLWPVSDVVTEQFTGRFHTRLAAGAPAAEALAAAAADLRRSSACSLHDALAFVLLGDGTATAELAPARRLPPTSVLVVAGSGLLATVLLLVRRRRPRR